MPTSIMIPLVGDQLGGSLCYEEHKGNYTQAREVASARVQVARRAGDAAQLADALLAAGTVDLLQGKPASATSCFAEAEQLAHHDVSRQLYAIDGSTLAAYYATNLFPGGAGANGGEEIDARSETLQAQVASQSQRRSALFTTGMPAAIQLTDRLLSDLLPNMLSMRSSLELLYTTQAADAEQIFNVGMNVPFQFRQYAESLAADPHLLAYPMLVAADLAWRGRRYDIAPACLREALQGYTQANDAAGAATCHMIWGDWLAAPFSSPLKWNFALQSSASEGSNLAWTVEAVEGTQQGSDLEQALAAYQTAETLFQQANAPRGLAALQLRHGYLAMLRNDYHAAATHARAAHQAFNACGDWLGSMLAQTHLLMSRVGSGEVAEQYELAQAVGRWGAAEGSFSYALGLGILLGRSARHWLLRGGNYERALAGYRLVAALFGALGATANQAQSLVDQADTYYVVGERNAARTVYEQALDLYEATISTRPLIAPMLRRRFISLAVSTHNLGVRTTDADEIERSAARLTQQLSHMPDPTESLATMMQALSGGVFEAFQNNTGFEGSAQVIDWSLRRLAQSTVEQAHMLVPLYRAQRARDAGNEQAALRLFADALTAARSSSSDDRDWLEATVFAQQKQYGPARAAFDRYASRGGASAGFVGQITDALSGAGSTGTAEVQRQHERNASLAFTFMVRIKAYDDAHIYFQRLCQLGGDNWWLHDSRPWLDLSDCAEMYEGRGQLPEALTFYDKAITAFEERRKLLSRDELKTAMASDKGAQYLYFLAARATLKASDAARQTGDQDQAQAHAAHAFDYMERGRARALLDLMAGSAALAGASATETQIMRDWRRSTAQLTVWRGLLAQERGNTSPDLQRMAALEQQIEVGEARLREIEVGLGTANPLLHQALGTQAQVITADQVCAALEPGVALLEYAFLGDDLLAWAFTRQGIAQTYRAPVDAKALARKIRDLHVACEHRRPWEPQAADLSAILLAPLASTIHACQRLIIVPYGAAHSLPFHILPWEEQPLIFVRPVSYLPSASALRFLERRSSTLSPRLFAVGNPADMAYTPPDGGAPVALNPLRAAEQEARFIASLFREGHVLIGAEATAAAVIPLLATYPLLHLATHGYLSESAPLLSAIMLASGTSLSVYELMGLRLDADLVVLSACNTAQGETTGGDDVLGLTRGLLAAGARAAIVSLWPVDDSSTSVLMGAFYRELRGGSPPAIALQVAQQHLRPLHRDDIPAELDKLRVEMAADNGRGANTTRQLYPDGMPIAAADYSHPFFWAPFVVVGA